MRTLLCVDTFAGSDAPVAWLERFVPEEPSPLCIVPIPRSRPVSFASSSRLRLLDELIAARSRRACEAAQERLRPRWPHVSVDLIDGDASEQLLRSAERWGAELVVLDGTARGAASPALAGVVRMAARHLECSVLVVNRGPSAVREIVLGMDGSPGAREAVRLLSQWRFDPTPRLLALGVVNSWWRETIAEAELPTAVSRELAEAEAREADHLRSMLMRTTASLTGTVSVDVQTMVGVPQELILQAAHERAADLLVVGHQGIERVRRLPLGSVAESLLLAAPCPILIGRK